MKGIYHNTVRQSQKKTGFLFLFCWQNVILFNCIYIV